MAKPAVDNKHLLRGARSPATVESRFNATIATKCYIFSHEEIDMMKPQQAPVAEPTLAQIQGYIAELEEAPPFAHQLGLATLLVSEINRIRFYMEAQGTYSELLELRLDAPTADVEPELSWRAMFKKIVHDLAPVQTDPDTLKDLDIAFGFSWLHALRWGFRAPSHRSIAERCQATADLYCPGRIDAREAGLRLR